MESGLPVDVLGADNLDSFLVAEDGGKLVGLIGLQLYGTIGLLRSLVVARDARKLGLGGKLIGALESAAQAAGVTELWLLTIDAENFFERHGFEIMTRDAAPASIQQTEEFSDLCPGTAYPMRKVMV
jgi:amino-acid N-acetyltransferase